MKNKNVSLAKLALLGATLIWGSSFFIMKNTLDDTPPFFLLAFRFSAAALILAIIFMKRLRTSDKRCIGMGIIMGVFLFCAYSFQTFGLAGTTPGKNAFLTAVYCVIVPFLYWISSKKRPDGFHIAASVICIGGIGLVSLDGGFTMVMGDLLTLVGGLFYALHIVAVARFSQVRDIFALTVLQFATAALLGWVTGFMFNTFPSDISGGSVLSLVYLSVFATATALLLQNIGQKYTSAPVASIILSLESVFGAAFSIIFYGESVTIWLALGFGLIFSAIMISETKLAFIFGKRT